MTSWRACAKPGCGELIPAGEGRCPGCKAEANRARGTTAQRGYSGQHASRFRPGVLRRDPICVCPGCAGHPEAGCPATATVADHFPLSRRELVALGMDANDPAHGRGLCASCHSRATQGIESQRSGWNAL